LAGTPSGPDGAVPVPFSIQIEHRGSSLLVSISGEFDLGATEQFRKVVQEITGKDVDDVEIDLRKVSFIDSTGLRMLVEAERITRERELTLRIVRGGSAAVERVLQITGLDKVLPLVDG
jgi:anti-sigma B factor antagonist